MNTKAQRMIAVLVLAAAAAFAGGLYLLQSAWRDCAAMDSSNQILLQENKELKEQLKQIPILIQDDSSPGNSDPASPSLSQAEEVTRGFLDIFYAQSQSGSPMEKWEAYKTYMTEELAQKYKPKEDAPSGAGDSSVSPDTTWTSSCEVQRIYSKADDTGAETFSVVLNHTNVKNDKNQQSGGFVILAKCHLSLVGQDWKIDQIVTVNTDISPYQFAS